MECYRSNCKEECNDLKKQYCINRLSKNQKNLLANLGRGYCTKCGNKTVKANYKGIQIQLCTECGVRNRKEVDMIG